MCLLSFGFLICDIVNVNIAYANKYIVVNVWFIFTVRLLVTVTCLSATEEIMEGHSLMMRGFSANNSTTLFRST